MEKTCIECGATFTGKRQKTCCRVCAFWSLYDKSGGPDACWNWQGYVNPRSGYGMANNDIAGKRISSHRLAWKIANLCDPDKLHILHKCDNRLCGNPAHLKIGTPRSNRKRRLAGTLRDLTVAPGLEVPFSGNFQHGSFAA